MPVPRSQAAFCCAHVTWECALVFLPDHKDAYQTEGKELKHDPTYDRKTNTAVCMACYAALTSASPSGLGLLHELDIAAQAVRRRGDLVVVADSIKGDWKWMRENWTVIPEKDASPSARSPGEPSESDDFAYFFTTEDRTRIKIGHSVDPVDRRGDLQAGTPDELEILHVTKGGKRVEKQWQRRFAHLHTGAGEEWFRADRELLDAIEKDRQKNPKEAKRMLRVGKERRERERARRLLRAAGYEGPYHPAQIRVAAATDRWRSMTRRARHFVLPWKDPQEHVAVLAFGEFLPPSKDDPAEEQLRTRAGKVPAWTHTVSYPAGERCNVPLEHLSLIRDADFEHAAAKAFDWTIPDLIAYQLRDGIGRTLVHHKLLEWWRQGFEFDPERQPQRPSWAIADGASTQPASGSLPTIGPEPPLHH